jgi:hypothetical protein
MKSETWIEDFVYQRVTKPATFDRARFGYRETVTLREGRWLVRVWRRSA